MIPLHIVIPTPLGWRCLRCHRTAERLVDVHPVAVPATAALPSWPPLPDKVRAFLEGL